MKKLRDILREDLESRMKKDPFFQDVKRNRDSAMQPVLKSPPSVTFDKDHSKKLEAGFARVQADLDKLDKKTLPPTAQTKVVTRPELPKVSVKKSNSLPNDDIFAGGNSPFAAPEVKNYDRGKQDRQNQELAREKKWQSVYKKPAGYGTPSYDKARDRDDAEWKSKLPANPYNDVPAEAVPGSIRPQFVDTMKTSPAVPVSPVKPPIPKLRPERKPVITNKDNTKGAVAIPEPDSVGINVKPSDKKAAPDQSIRKIQKGDTFWDIAGGNPEEVKRLKKLNPKVNPSKLQIGQEIRLK